MKPQPSIPHPHRCLHCGWRYFATCQHPDCPACKLLNEDGEKQLQRENLLALDGGKTENGQWLH